MSETLSYHAMRTANAARESVLTSFISFVLIMLHKTSRQGFYGNTLLTIHISKIFGSCGI